MKQLDVDVSLPCLCLKPLYELLSSNFCLVTDEQTDRQKARQMSPSCSCTGGLKNLCEN